jgi:L-asparaginase / beta-aspartyl-peptidase
VTNNPVLIVHGGAWAIPDEVAPDHITGVQNALAAGWSVLERGGSAVEAVETAIVVMEDDETFDAGRGSFLNSDGRAQLDSMVMEGRTLRAGGVGCVERIKNPVRAARKILEDSPHVYIVGPYAERFAEQHGIALCENSELVTEREIQRLKNAKAQVQLSVPDEFVGAQAKLASHDTVGAVALDWHGDVAAATSTGGTLNKTPGRVGDSSLIGCGCYADNQSAAVSTTGWGEAMMKLVLGKWACDRVLAGAPPELAAIEALDYMKKRLNGNGGMILLDPSGRYGIAHNTPRMAWAMKSRDKEGWGIDRS